MQQLLQLATVCKKVACSKSTLYQLIRGEGFPRGVTLTGDPQRGRRGVRWLESDVDAWISTKFGKLSNAEGGAK